MFIILARSIKPRFLKDSTATVESFENLGSISNNFVSNDKG